MTLQIISTDYTMYIAFSFLFFYKNEENRIDSFLKLIS